MLMVMIRKTCNILEAVLYVTFRTNLVKSDNYYEYSLVQTQIQ